MAQNKSSIRRKLTDQTLQELKDEGFQYVLIKDYTPDRRLDHIQLNHFILVPVMQLPTDPGEKEIFAPIDSEVLLDWVSSINPTFEAYIEIH
jgi:hypothetical protein